MAKKETVPPPVDPHHKYLVTGGNGFIGSHVARALFDRGAHVRVADIVPSSAFKEPICHEMLVGDLCDAHFCDRAVKGMDTVLHFAVTRGDADTIHDLTTYQTNARITSNVLIASIRADVRVFFFASSAHVHATHKQENLGIDVSSDGEDVQDGRIPPPQGCNGLEKLVFELLQRSVHLNIRVQIARFHSVYGPRDAWNDGREEVPSALLRKALATRLVGNDPEELEIAGDCRRRQSYLFIDDCVDAILALLACGYDKPLNIGSDRAVTLNDLAEIAIKGTGRAGLDDMSNINADVLGVRTENSDNHLIEKVLFGWTPKVSLEDGMARTAGWIQEEMEKIMDGTNEKERISALQAMCHSKIVDRAGKDIKVAILLPISTCGPSPPTECLSRLNAFAESLARTTWRDTHRLGGQRFVIKVYLAIGRDDSFLVECDLKTEMNIAEAVFVSQNICDVTIQFCNWPCGHVYAIWRQIARQAWMDGCDYFALLGDNIVLKDEGWLRDTHATFSQMAQRAGTPPGFGCVAFTDINFPGIPTFPIVHRTHLDIFAGDVVPEIFVDRGGESFLYQLYRRWDCSSMSSARVLNVTGVNRQERYHRQHAKWWTFGPLDKATATTEEWLSRRYPAVSRKLTLDVVIPSFRVQLQYLETMLNLKPPPTCTTMFIIVIDNPHSPVRAELETKFASRPDVRIRVNNKNLGASASRNRGMEESAAEWVIFLDDDVIPQPDLLVEAEKVIRANPNAAGFIGTAQLPSPNSIFTTALHFAGVVYFWDIAKKFPDETDLPWGVTANLITRRIDDGVEFDLELYKTGGGEDIDFCIRKRDWWFPAKQQGFHPAPGVVANHLWWNGGKRSYRRFYVWAKGDAGLVKLHPNLSYMDDAPNGGELLLISCVLGCVGTPLLLFTGITFPSVLALHLVGGTIVGNMVHDVYRHLYRDTDRTTTVNSTLTGLKLAIAAAESSLIRLICEWGRVVVTLERGEMENLGRRFDLFAFRMGDGPMNEERRNSRQRVAVIVVVLAATLCAVYR